MENSVVNYNINRLLQDAALKGDVITLRDLLDQDPFLLHKHSTNIYPLHIASKLGHLQFTQELLRVNPSLAEELTPSDRSSPLHLASANGHVELVETLVNSTNDASMCLARDVHGRNPAHVAAMKGHVRVLEELLRAVPAAARERVGDGTILHLSVKCNQLEALWTVVNVVGDAGMMLNAKDGDGNTVLHLAVADKRVEIVHFLVNDNRVRKNMQNSNGLTAMDIFVQDNKGHNKNPLLRFTLEQATALQSKDIKEDKTTNNGSNWVKYQGSALMVVASLVATMAFQAGLSPPGKSSQDDRYLEFYNRFVVANTIGLVSSMSSIILLISGLPGRRFFMVLVMVMMWVTVTSMTYSYAISVEQLSPRPKTSVGDNAQLYSLYVWSCVMVLLLLGHLVTCPRRLNSKLTCLSG